MMRVFTGPDGPYRPEFEWPEGICGAVVGKFVVKSGYGRDVPDPGHGGSPKLGGVDAIEDAIATLRAARPDLAPPTGRVAHKLFIWYLGEQDPEVFDIPARCWLWEQVDEPRVVERIELYEAQEYSECAARHAVDGHRHEDRWGISGRPGGP